MGALPDAAHQAFRNERLAKFLAELGLVPVQFFFERLFDRSNHPGHFGDQIALVYLPSRPTINAACTDGTRIRQG
jgi:hypothetical protein